MPIPDSSAPPPPRRPEDPGESAIDESVITARFPAAWWERQTATARGLVLLGPAPISELEESVADLESRLQVHAREMERRWRTGATSAEPARGRSVARADHDRFVVSVDQLRWFLTIVRHDDHGGNRQALGQYWTIVLEALRRHLEEEGVDELDSYAHPPREGALPTQRL